MIINLLFTNATTPAMPPANPSASSFNGSGHNKREETQKSSSSNSNNPLPRRSTNSTSLRINNLIHLLNKTFIWLLGHIGVLLFSLLWLFTQWTTFYRSTFICALTSWSLSLYGSLENTLATAHRSATVSPSTSFAAAASTPSSSTTGTGTGGTPSQPAAVGPLRFLLNENSPYVLLTLFIVLLRPLLPLLLIPYSIYSLYQVAQFLETDPMIRKTPYWISLGPRIAFLLQFKDAVFRIASHIELAILPLMIVSWIFRGSERIWDIFLYFQFLRWQCTIAPRMKNAFEEWKIIGAHVYAKAVPIMREYGIKI